MCSNPGPPGYVALILAFIGVKFALHGGHLQSDRVRASANGTSLAVIAAVLASTRLSVCSRPAETLISAHAGPCGTTRSHRLPLRPARRRRPRSPPVTRRRAQEAGVRA
jgi:hypothetical protein